MVANDASTISVRCAQAPSEDTEVGGLLGVYLVPLVKAATDK